MRLTRNHMMKDLLLSGRSVQYRGSGNSLAPLVRSGDVTMWDPVRDPSTLVVGDVVFCLVQPGDRFYGHMIHEVGEWDGVPYWSIGNAKNPPHINGWCQAEHIFGRLMEVSPIPPSS